MVIFRKIKTFYMVFHWKGTIAIGHICKSQTELVDYLAILPKYTRKTVVEITT